MTSSQSGNLTSQREIVVIISCASGALVKDRGKRVSKRGWEFVVFVISSKNRLIWGNGRLSEGIPDLEKPQLCGS